MRKAAEVFHPGELVREELEERGWSQADLAEILGRPARLVSELLSGARAVTAETAKGLGEAFGTGPDLWMGLQSSFDLHQAVHKDDAVARRAKMFSAAPIRDMIRRGWIEESKNLDVLEKQVCEFFEIKSIDEKPQMAFAAKTSFPEQTTAHSAWLFRAKALARSVSAGSFTAQKLERCLASLRQLMHETQETRHVSKTLADAGIRLVVVEPLPRTRIDGAHFRLTPKEPVIALSLRYDRIDSFWHVLGHELGHLKYNHAPHVDLDIGKNTQDDDRERAANEFAQNLLIPDGELDNFIARVRPLYSHKGIASFARRIGVHPGVVVGQLQFRREIGYQHSRKMLEKVRDTIIESTLTDGWGCIAPPSL